MSNEVPTLEEQPLSIEERVNIAVHLSTAASEYRCDAEKMTVAKQLLLAVQFERQEAEARRLIERISL